MLYHIGVQFAQQVKKFGVGNSGLLFGFLTIASED
jgi:hypothetical protein